MIKSDASPFFLFFPYKLKEAHTCAVQKGGVSLQIRRKKEKKKEILTGRQEYICIQRSHTRPTEEGRKKQNWEYHIKTDINCIHK